jgi:membrane fusion protein, multidrug efflux system
MDKTLLRPSDPSQRTKWRRRLNIPGGVKTIWILLAAIAIALAIWFFRPSQERMGRFGMGGPMPVGVATAALGDIPLSLNALGTVTPLSTVTVRPQVSGQIVKIDFTEGQMVAVGDVLAEIDPRPYQAALDQAQGQLARDQAALENAKIDLARYETLLKQNSIAQQQVATQRALVNQDQGVIKADQAAVENAQINLDYCKITAPISGRVGLRQVDLGNLVTAGSTTGIVVLTQEQPTSVVFAVPEDSIDQIVGRFNSGAKLEVDAYDRSQTKKLATGTLATIDNQIDTTTGTVKLRAMFDNTDGVLFPNQFVNVRLLVDTLHNQVTVPTAAIQTGASGNFVFLVNKADSTVHMQTVTEGPSAGTVSSIASGLEAGDVVVVDGADRLKDGEPVQLPGAKAPAPTTVQNFASFAGGARGQRGAALQKACSADMQKFCGSAQGFARFQCLREHKSDLSQSCQQALAKMHHGGGGRGGFGGGP